MDTILAASKFSKPTHRKAADDFVKKYKESGGRETRTSATGSAWPRTTTARTVGR